MQEHAAIVIKDGGRLLFVQRAASKKALPNAWAFPSGTVMPGETPEQTAVREAHEELGVDVVAEGTLAEIVLEESGVKLAFVACSVSLGTPTIREPAEIQSLRWLTLDDFFREYGDDRIGHGLVFLRAHPEISARF